MSPMSLTRVSALLMGLALSAQAIITQPSAEANAVCAELEDKFSNKLAYNALSPDADLEKNADYITATTNYWSAANTGNKPACVFLPEDATQVQFAVKVLQNYTSVPWAVKGGGHNPNVGFSSSNGGLLIAMQRMSETTLDSNNLAHVGPGSLWQDAVSAIEPFGRTVVGGRIGNVGVAGYTLGGGLSFLSTQYGFTVDNTVEFEVVTAEGEIVKANSEENTDLFFALKGGGGQFGIVTSYVMNTYPIGKVWGGYKIFTADKKDRVIAAVHNLTSDYHDPKAAVIATVSYTLQNLVQIFVVFFFYDSPSGPGAILDEFNGIPAFLDTTKVRSYSDLLTANNAFSLRGQRYLIRFNSIPNLPGADGIDLYTHQFDAYMKSAAQYQLQTPIESFIFSFAYQPMPAIIAEQSQARGGNRLNMQPEHGDRMWMEYDLSWTLNLTDSKAAQYMAAAADQTQRYSRETYPGREPTNYQSGNVDVTNYNPIFMNDAMFNQNPLRTYGESTYQQLLRIQRDRDSNGLFQNRTGGFKYT